MQPFFLLVITGMSGAGKSLALSRLEDNGFYCVDNLPSKLLPGFVEQCRGAEPAIRYAAVGIDAREIAFGLAGVALDETLEALHVDHQIVFLDCSDDVLRRRYVETRRKHPFAGDGDVLRGIEKERELLAPLRESADSVVDTSGLTPLALFEKLDRELKLQPKRQMNVLFMSFGFKRGMPIDADTVLDMRFLPNPFYIPELRPLSGLDVPVRDYVVTNNQAQAFFDETEKLLHIVLPGYLQQGKRRVVVAFGCTGGRHRSVAAAEEMHARMQGAYQTRCFHRDLTIEADDIHTRFREER